MDSLTQAALGAAMGEAVLGRKLGNRGMLWGILFGTLPDLDVLASPLIDHARQLEFHRGASHSLLIMVLASLLLARPLARLWRKQKVSTFQAGSFVFLAWSTHVLIDCFTIYGTTVLWPFSEKRVAFNNLFIIDPLYTIPLLVSLVWLCFLRSKKQQAKRKKRLIWGLGLSSAYVLFSFGMKGIASSAFAADLQRRNVSYSRRIEAPTPFNTLLWRSVVDREDELWVGYRSVFEWPSSSVRWTVYPKNKEALSPFRNEREIEIIDWFSDSWWIARSHAQGVWVGDLRFGETRIHGQKPGAVDSRILFSWSFFPKNQGERLRSVARDIGDPKESLRRIFVRIFTKNAWEGNPRLTGVPGALSEHLPVVE